LASQQRAPRGWRSRRKGFTLPLRFKLICQARVFSAFIKDVDKRPDPTVWGTRLPFNTLCAEFPSPAGGWVHSVAFSPSGDVLAFTSHDSTVTIAYPAGPEEPPRTIINVRTPLLPFESLVWITETELIAAGHDCQPIVFKGSDQGWCSSPSEYQLMTGKWGGVWTTRQRGQVAVKVRLLRLICSGIWTAREVPRRQVKILPFQLFIKIPLRTESH
jgi:hypothetical protein